MNILPIIKISLNSMLSNKVRTGLTILGMVVGIASIIVVFSAGEGIKSLVLNQIKSFGTDVIETEIKVPSSKKGHKKDVNSATSIATGVQITSLTLDDMKDIEKLSNVKDAYAGILGQELVSYRNEMHKGILMGTNATYVIIDESKVDQGRFFTETENKSLAQVAVLGKELKRKLFGDSDAIGKMIKIGKSKYEVIGVMKKRGSTMGMKFDDFVYLPIRTLQKKILGVKHIVYMMHRLYNVDLAEDTAEQAREILRRNHNISNPDKDDFRVTTMEEMLDTLDVITGAITLLLLAIVAISLLVGGVGIMNIMYVVVSERKSEIGLRKAVGAQESDIVKQFLFESILITIIGAIIGIFLGILFSFLIYLGANHFGLDWSFVIPLKAFLTAFGFSLFFGVIFGLYPARKASKLNPIEALRQ